MSIHKKIDASKRFLHTVIEAYQKNGKSIYLANSGGKDSLVCYTLLKEIGANIPVIHSNTTIDPPGTLPYIREVMPETIIINPEESFFQLVARKMFPSRWNRYCCQVLKERYGIGRSTIEGVRASESTKRTGRDLITCDSRPEMKGAEHIYPIYDWLDEDIYGFVKIRNLELAPCYRAGLSRLGCVGCPQITRKGVREFEFSLYPRYYEACKKAIRKGMELHPTWKISRYTDGDEEKAMRWWLSGKTMKEFFGYDIPFIRLTKKAHFDGNVNIQPSPLLLGFETGGNMRKPLNSESFSGCISDFYKEI